MSQYTLTELASAARTLLNAKGQAAMQLKEGGIIRSGFVVAVRPDRQLVVVYYGQPADAQLVDSHVLAARLRIWQEALTDALPEVVIEKHVADTEACGLGGPHLDVRLS